MSFKRYLIHWELLEAKKRKFDMAVDAESNYNLVVFSTFTKKVAMPQGRKQDHQSNIIYANTLRKFYQSQQN